MEGYVNGSNMLLLIENKALGHCSTHTCTFNTETKEHAVKPPASQSVQKGKFKEKTVSGLSYTIEGEGLTFYGEPETSFKELMDLWIAGEPVKVKCIHRGESTSPYLEGYCIIDNLKETSPAEEDTTYSISLTNSGAPTKFNSKIFGTLPVQGGTMNNDTPPDEGNGEEGDE